MECQSEIKDYKGNRGKKKKKPKTKEDHSSQIASTPMADFPGATTHVENSDTHVENSDTELLQGGTRSPHY